MKKKLIALAMAVLTTFSTLLAGCGSTAATGESTENGLPSTVKIAIVNSFAPFAYVDEEGNPAGFDYEIAREAYKRLGIEAEFTPLPIDSLLSGVQAGKYDMGTSGLFATEERAKTYTFPDFPYAKSTASLVLNKDYEGTVTDLGDLSTGAKFGEIASDILVQTLQKYSDENNKDFDIEYYETADVILNDVASKRIDATLYDSISAHAIVENNGLSEDVYFIEGDYSSNYCFPVFQKSETALARAYSDTIKEMYEDGTIAKLSQEILGSDIYAQDLDQGVLSGQ